MQIVEKINIETIDKLLETIKLVYHVEKKLLMIDLEPHLERLCISLLELKFQLLAETVDLSKQELRNFIMQFLQDKFSSAQIQNSSILLEESESRVLEVYKLRFIYTREYGCSMELHPYQCKPSPYKIKLLKATEYQSDSQNLANRHKYLPRLDFSSLMNDCDEVLWFNEHMHLCEGSYTNVFFQNIHGQWCTPHLDSGILAGISRAHFITKLAAIEAYYYEQDLHDARQIMLTNSMIGAQVAIMNCHA